MSSRPPFSAGCGTGWKDSDFDTVWLLQRNVNITQVPKAVQGPVPTTVVPEGKLVDTRLVAYGSVSSLDL